MDNNNLPEQPNIFEKTLRMSTRDFLEKEKTNKPAWNRKNLVYLIAGLTLISLSSLYLIISKNELQKKRSIKNTNLSVMTASTLTNDPLYKKYQEQEAGLEKIEKEVATLNNSGLSVRRNEDNAGYKISYRPVVSPQMSEEEREEFQRQEREKFSEVENNLLKRHHDSALPDLDVEEEEMVQSFREQMKKGEL
jgi:hypothetical protein